MEANRTAKKACCAEAYTKDLFVPKACSVRSAYDFYKNQTVSNARLRCNIKTGSCEHVESDAVCDMSTSEAAVNRHKII